MSLLDETPDERARLHAANAALAAAYPGEPQGRQPVHTVYLGAQHFGADAAPRLGERALRSLDRYAPDAATFARALGMAGVDAGAVYARVRAKLEREPVEDLRIDFEDGFGARPDDEEDRAAIAAARELGRAIDAGVAPPFRGIRVKSLGPESTARAARTLELFVGALLEGRGLPGGFVVTLPKVQAPEQPRAFARWMDRLEARHRLPRGSLRFEIMVETTQAFLGADGRSPLPTFLDACEGRCTGVHLGVYDFTASCSVAAAHQSMAHPMCALARHLMRLAYGGRGVFLSDGSTNVLPVGPHEGEPLTAAQQAENAAAVHRAWRLSYESVRASLAGSFYQGWDLHPAQLPVRFAACYAFYLEGFAAAAARLRAFVDRAARPSAQIADEPATGQALLDFVRRAWACGAIGDAELASAGLAPADLAHPTLAKILAAR